MLCGFVCPPGAGSGASWRTLAPALVAGLALLSAVNNAQAATVVVDGDSSAITIPVSGPTVDYPSTIVMSGTPEDVIIRVSVQLNGLSHSWWPVSCCQQQ